MDPNISALVTDRNTIDTLLDALRAVRFRALSPAGRAEAANALAALYRARDEADEQIRRAAIAAGGAG